MADLSKVQAVYTSFIGGPGVNTFYVSQSTPDLEAFHEFYSDLDNIFPTDVTISFPGEGPVVDSVTGGLTGAWESSSELPVDGTGADGYIAGAGVCVRWVTNAILGRRRVIGRTFLVPATIHAFGTDGQVTGAVITEVTDAATALVEALDGHLMVWHRPVNEDNGLGYQVQTATVSTIPANLRSRKR